MLKFRLFPLMCVSAGERPFAVNQTSGKVEEREKEGRKKASDEKERKEERNTLGRNLSLLSI